MEAADNAFILAKKNNVIAFYKGRIGSVLPANRAFLQLASSAATVKMNFIGEETGVEHVVVEDPDAPVYDLSGRRVLQVNKGGIYIKNGKKFIVR